MARVTWGNPGERLYEVGVDRGVLYPQTGPGVPWSGLIAVNEAPTGGDSTPYYIDGIRYQDRGAPEEFAGSIEAYTYPKEFALCDGTASLSTGLFATQQYRRPFGLTYRTKIGNDLEGTDHGYKIHIVYNARATPSERNHQSIKDSPEAITFNWDFSTIPVRVAGVKPTAHLIIDSTITDELVVSTIEDILYGTSGAEASLPTPEDILQIFLEEGPVQPFVVTTPDSAGIFSVSGASYQVLQLDPSTFQLSADTVTDNGDGTYTASSA